ncbi:MAG TPA: DNA (cytosine-5-)-methyltransferase [bacterium (Candidatus Stahlbacteria)]|nr:DNA (cytosine-5-)-methyltransferase [Candidatus Stahlbacteria bacterium]
MSKKKYVVVSLFDGLSGGRITFDKLKGVKVLRYYSSEIDTYAIQIADKNYPGDTEYRLGNVIRVNGKKLRKAIRKEFGKDVEIILIGGSPCQGFSLSGKLNGSSTSCGIDVTTYKHYKQLRDEGFEFAGQSWLFWEYVRIRKQLKPDYFFLENVRVTKKWLPMFNKEMGVEPILINSALVSAQNRQRFYWTNIPGISQPKDKGILMKDICETVVDDSYAISELFIKGCLKHKASTITNPGKNRQTDNYILRERPCTEKEFDSKSTCHHAANADDIKGHDYIKRVYGGLGKSPALTSMQGGNHEPKVLTNPSKYRKLTPLECERLQTLPDNYTEGVSNSQRYKMIGNGWTIKVIKHLFKGLR